MPKDRSYRRRGTEARDRGAIQRRETISKERLQSLSGMPKAGGVGESEYTILRLGEWLTELRPGGPVVSQGRFVALMELLSHGPSRLLALGALYPHQSIISSNLPLGTPFPSFLGR